MAATPGKSGGIRPPPGTAGGPAVFPGGLPDSPRRRIVADVTDGAVVLNRVDALNEHSYAETPIGRIDGSALPGNRGTHNGQLRGRPRISGRTHEDAQRNGSEPGGRRLSLEEKKKGRVRLLLIGPLPAKSASLGEPIGGSRMTFAEAVRELDLRGFDLDVINTARPRPNLPLWKILSYEFLTFVRVAWTVLRRARRSDLVFLHMSAYSALSASSIIWALCRALRRPLALRFFGDSLYFTYHRYGPARRWLMDRTCLRASLVYEERWTPRKFSNRDNFRWLANTRDIIPAETRRDRDRVRRLIFMGQLRKEKGLAEALEACRSLPQDCHLQVFGPRMPNTDFSLFDRPPQGDLRRGAGAGGGAPRPRRTRPAAVPQLHEKRGYPGSHYRSLPVRRAGYRNLDRRSPRAGGTRKKAGCWWRLAPFRS